MKTVFCPKTGTLGTIPGHVRDISGTSATKVRLFHRKSSIHPFHTRTIKKMLRKEVKGLRKQLVEGISLPYIVVKKLVEAIFCCTVPHFLIHTISINLH